MVPALPDVFPLQPQFPQIGQYIFKHVAPQWLRACIFFLYRRNIFNEWLVRDTSKKIRAVKRSKGMSGKPVTSKPVYGYLMDEDENFIIDGEAAPVVKQIYSLCYRKESSNSISHNLPPYKLAFNAFVLKCSLSVMRWFCVLRFHAAFCL